MDQNNGLLLLEMQPDMIRFLFFGCIFGLTGFVFWLIYISDRDSPKPKVKFIKNIP